MCIGSRAPIFIVLNVLISQRNSQALFKVPSTGLDRNPINYHHSPILRLFVFSFVALLSVSEDH